MSTYKKREVAPPPPRDALSASLCAAVPAVGAILQSVGSTLASVRRARFTAEWNAAKQTAVRPLQLLINGWIKHR
jgi:hypothetical protein